jgi:hypothetical protein
MSTSRQTFTPQFKVAAIKRLPTAVPVGQAARELQVNPNQLHAYLQSIYLVRLSFGPSISSRPAKLRANHALLGQRCPPWKLTVRWAPPVRVPIRRKFRLRDAFPNRDGSVRGLVWHRPADTSTVSLTVNLLLTRDYQQRYPPSFSR